MPALIVLVYQGRSQFGQRLRFAVFQGRVQHIQGIGDIFRLMWRFDYPINFKQTAAAYKTGDETLKDGQTINEIITNTLKLTLGMVLATTSEQDANHFLKDKPTAALCLAPSIGPPPGTLVEPLPLQSGPVKQKIVYTAHF